MQKFTSVKDIPDLKKAIETALQIKKDRFAFRHLGEKRTMVLIFFNPSLRTRLSTQKAAINLGMNTMVLNVNKDSWQLETGMGVKMDGDKPEHLREAIPVIGKYCDIIGVRAFARFESRESDYSEEILNQFVTYSGVPVVSMEGAIRHPLQSFADLLTIEEYKVRPQPKVVLTWAPHPKALPQAVPNSFVEWMRQTDYELVVTHPEGYELAPEFMGDTKVEYDQGKAFKDADFIYAKNWSSYSSYGKILSNDYSWTVNERKMALTDNAYFMHCLPVRRNVIVTDSVIDSPASIVVEQAANREITAQTVLKMILESI
ncbi:MAG: N-acetylornithine carbamoyltransferase [Bacteroidales bacterium]|jgi:N-succinyl-L-ornithine transcarbamylase|nr:N-acetylornithine carbamoyltransferase [Bacteroidales bacterium]